MKQDIENIIRTNLPEKKEDDGFAQDPSVAFNNGFDEALSQIDTSLLADEVLKVVVEIYDKSVEIAEKKWTEDVLKNGSSVNPLDYIRRELLSNLSLKENENNEI